MAKHTTDRFRIIDRDTFDEIVQVSKVQKQKQIRNSKYKNTRTEFSLLNFITGSTKHQSQKKRKQLIYPRLPVGRRYQLKRPTKHGKKRENKRKSCTKLKKIILKNRLMRLKKLNDGSQWIDDEVSELLQNNIHNATKVPIIGNPLVTNTNTPPAMTVPSLGNPLVTSTTPPITIQEGTKLFSRRFRSYCDNLTTVRLKELTNLLLRDLDRFQKRAYMQNPIKALAHRRFVVGFRETRSYLNINKVKLLIMATDIEPCPVEGGLDDTVEAMKIICHNQNVPYAFPMQRRELKYALYKHTPIACVAILDYDGANATFTELLKELQEARQLFNLRTATKMELNGLENLFATINMDK